MVVGRQTAKGGLAPASLDASIKRSAESLDQVLKVWDALHPMVTSLMQAVSAEVEATERLVKEGVEVEYRLRKDGKPATRDLWLRETTHDLVTWTEKLSRTLAAMTKSVDEASRLRDFLTGGESGRQDLENASDQELIQCLIDVSIARNLWPAIRARMAELGVVVDNA